jgi:type II secretory pathway component PulF
MKYKIVGTANYLIGGVQILISLTLFFVVVPRMQSLYRDFNAEVSLTKSYLAPIINIVLGIFAIFLGHKLFFSKGRVLEKYFTISIVYLVATFITAGIITQLSILSIIQPLYDLSSSLN